MMENSSSRRILTPRRRRSSQDSLPPLLTGTPASLGATPTRQTRLLQARNARFSAQRLSVSKIGSKIAQRTRNGGTKLEQEGLRSKENTPPVSRFDEPSPAKNKSPDIGSSPSVSMRHRYVYEDTLSKATGLASQELAESRHTITKRHSSPLIYQSSFSKGSPTSSNTSCESARSMRLREVSGNEYRPLYQDSSPRTNSHRRARLQKSKQAKSHFDAENYIEHIENELQQAQEALISPTTNKTLQHQLRSARSENDRLRQELTEMRNAFEAEVKMTLEHKTSAEVELKRRVKLLEDELDGKVSVIEELEYQHEEKRLDNGTLDTLKATIERLEAEKLSMAEENRSMTKRNEVLSELLAMSPTKTRMSFEPRSPVREKRPGRPMSLIIPRLPSSPIVTPLGNYVTSPTTSSPLVSDSQPQSLATEIAPLSLNISELKGHSDADFGPRNYREQLPDTHSKSQSTSDASISGSVCSPSLSASRYPLPSSPVHEQTNKAAFKRRPRKFMHGSTQLKPLLLPTLRNDSNSQSSASALGSPGSMISGEQYQDPWEADSYFGGLGTDVPLSNTQTGFDRCTQNSVLSNSDSSKDLESYRQTVDEILAQDMTTLSPQFPSSDDANDVSQVSGFALTGPGPPLRNDQVAWDNDNSHQTSLSYGHLREGIRDHESDPTQSLQKSNSHSFGLSSPFDFEALRLLRLPQADFDKLPRGLTTDDARLSVIPEPLFSPVVKQVAEKSSSMVSPGDRLSKAEWMDPANHGRRQPKHALQNTIVSPTPVGSKQSAFLCTPSDKDTTPSILGNDKEIGLKPPRSPLSTATISISRSMTPLEFLNRRQFGARPLAAFTIRTICTALSRCTAFVRDIKTDPLALARKVLANAWFANWKRFGGLSWWVLGLFLPQQIIKPDTQWDWDDFDGEEIAERCCHDSHTEHSEYDEPSKHYDQSMSMITQKSYAQDVDARATQASEQDSKPGWCKSIFLWGKFSIALMLAVGGAVVKGPAEMMRDIEQKTSVSSHDLALRQRRSCLVRCHLDGSSPMKAIEHGKESSSQETFAFRRPYGTIQSVHPSETASFSNDDDSSPPSLPRGSGQFANLLPDLGDWNAMDEHTLKPAKTRRRHVGGIFEQVQLNETASDSTHHRHWSRMESIDDGFLKWPPDLESVRSNCRSST